jgi:choline dehydrogenase-like flavoprotein
MADVTTLDFDYVVIGSGFGGSVVPVNLGVNPSLTITALSEFIMSQIPARAQAAAPT